MTSLPDLFTLQIQNLNDITNKKRILENEFFWIQIKSCHTKQKMLHKRIRQRVIMAIGGGGAQWHVSPVYLRDFLLHMCHYLDKTDLNANGHFDIDNGFKK